MTLRDLLLSLPLPYLAPEGDGSGGGADGGSGGGSGSDGSGAGSDGGSGVARDAGKGGEGTGAGEGAAGDGKGSGDAGKGADGKSTDSGDKGGGEPWYKDVPAEHLKTAAKYKTLAEFTKAHGELQGRLGQAIFRPGDKATDAERAAFYKALGRPDTADGYKAPKLEGVDIPAERFKAFAEGAHKAGLSQSQLDALIGHEVAISQRIGEARAAAMREGHGKLEKDWGDDTEANYERARRVASIMFDENDGKLFGIAGEDPKTWPPQMVRLLHKLAPSFEDHRSFGRSERDIGKSDDSLQQEADELMQSEKYRKGDPTTHARVREIFESRYGKEPIGR